MCQQSVLSVDLMQPPGYFTGERLSGPVCWPTQGLLMMNGQTQGLCPGVDGFPGLYNVTLQRKHEEDL